MPHDRNNQPLQIGDLVNVPCRVAAVARGEDYCNLVLLTLEPCRPGTHQTVLDVNSRQVVLASVLAPSASVREGAD